MENIIKEENLFSDVSSLNSRSNSLIEALPYIRKFFGKTFVIKFGGSAMAKECLKDNFALDVVLLKYVGINPVVVHGGGKEINTWLEKLGKKSTFVNGLRITDAESMNIIEMVLAGKINKEIVNLINCHGGAAVGLSGKDGKLILAKKMGLQGGGENEKGIDMGMVGDVKSINPRVVEVLDEGRFIPVISPVAVNEKGETFNINADMVAARIASALKAEKLIMLTDVPGILNEKGELLQSITIDQGKRLLKDRTVQGGMQPKLSSCLDVLESGVRRVHIINGKIDHCLLLEIFTDTGVGTVIY